MLQMMRQIVSGQETFGLAPRVSFGDLIGLPEVGTPEHAMQAITLSARRLLQSHLAWQV
jgi:hypothetical protein